MNAGKSTTSIFHTASIPSSGYSRTSTFLMQSWASRGAADRSEIEAAVLLARLGDGRRSVSLREHHHAAARGLERIDVRVHATRGRRSERSARHALRRLRRTGVVHGEVLHVLGHAL